MSPTVVIHGVYAKGERPRKDEIPEDYSVKDLAPDQIMVRERIGGISKLVPEQGLMAPGKPLLFYHADIDDHDESDDEEEDDDDPFEYPLEETDRIYEERTVLLQSMENYQHLARHPTLSKFMPSRPEDALIDPRFGEQLIVSGMDNSRICIGDIFEIKNGGRLKNNNNLKEENKLQLQVTSPRLPCSYVDKRNGSPFGMKGLKRYTMTHGLAGWFVRVLREGAVYDGMELVRVRNPHPKWTLEYTSKTLYGEGDKKHNLLCWAQWARSKRELEELCSLPELGWYEWKAEAQWLLDRWGREDVMVKQDRNGAKSESLPSMFAKSSSDLIHSNKLKFDAIMQSVLGMPQYVTSNMKKKFSHFMAFAIVGLAWLGLRAVGGYP